MIYFVVYIQCIILCKYIKGDNQTAQVCSTQYSLVLFN